MYQDYATKSRLFKAEPETLAAEFDRDVAMAADPQTSFENGSTVYTHRTGSQSITNVDEYLRALTPHGTSGYGSIYYANVNGVSYSQHNNRYYVIAVTPLSGGGGGGM